MPPRETSKSGSTVSATAPAGSAAGSNGNLVTPAAVSGSAAGGPAAGSGGASAAPLLRATPTAELCDTGAPFKKEGCACPAGQAAACWTGSPADRNVGKCHDGVQICMGGSEFATWGKCTGEEKECGADAGVPPPPPTDEDCTCVPGAVIQCSEDCSVGIICSFTATKTCLPDGTWTECREEPDGLSKLGSACRNMLHGCLDALQPGMPASTDGELFVGDCNTQFKCGHPPPPVTTPGMPSADPT